MEMSFEKAVGCCWELVRVGVTIILTVPATRYQLLAWLQFQLPVPAIAHQLRQQLHVTVTVKAAGTVTVAVVVHPEVWGECDPHLLVQGLQRQGEGWMREMWYGLGYGSFRVRTG